MSSAAVAEPDRSAMRANDPAISPAGRLLMMLPDSAAPIPLVHSTAHAAGRHPLDQDEQSRHQGQNAPGDAFDQAPWAGSRHGQHQQRRRSARSQRRQTQA
ncbi:hypothetical protein G6F59_018407 [Rhizopus arrhizus]|nr:hypothetical protein G6F59_018407 [Rhizopus arrhizus]